MRSLFFMLRLVWLTKLYSIKIEFMEMVAQ